MPQKDVEAQIGARHECMACKRLVDRCSICKRPIKRGYWVECYKDAHNHVRCPDKNEAPDVWD